MRGRRFDIDFGMDSDTRKFVGRSISFIVYMLYFFAVLRKIHQVPKEKESIIADQPKEERIIEAGEDFVITKEQVNIKSKDHKGYKPIEITILWVNDEPVYCEIPKEGEDYSDFCVPVRLVESGEMLEQEEPEEAPKKLILH